MPYIGRDLNRGNYLKLDDISSSFNGSTQTFNLTVGGSAFTPGSAFSILVSVGGVIQEPESAYQVENSEITFANAPTAQDGFFCIALGVPIGIGVPGSGTVNGAQMSKPFNYDGFFYLDDTNNRVGIGTLEPTSTLDVIGNAKISGILTAVSYSGPISNPSGISTFYNLRVINDLTVEGSTTTLDTNLVGVDRVEVGANSNTVVGVAITQSGTADIVNLFDGTTNVVTIDDTGNVGLGSAIPSGKLDVVGLTNLDDGNVSGVVTFTNSPNAIQMNDNARVSFGTSLKTSISYNASTSRTIIRNFNDTLEIGYRSTELHYINQARLTIAGSNTFSADAPTTFTGANYHASWIPASDKFQLNDNAKLAFGSQQDAEAYHTGGNFFIDNDTGHFYIRNNVAADVDKNIYIQAKIGENSISCGNDGEVVLFSNSISASQAKLQTTGHGVYVTGIGTFTTSVKITGSQNAELSSNILSFDRAGYSYIDQTNDSGSLVFRVKANNTIALRLDSSAQSIFGASAHTIVGYGGTGHPYNNNSLSLYGTANIGLVGRYSSINMPMDHSNANVGGNWWMLGRAHGTTNEWGLSSRPGDSNTIRRIWRVVNKSDNTGLLDYQSFHANNGFEALRINSSGQLLIGTETTPADNDTKLRVHFDQNTSSGSAIDISHRTNGADKTGAQIGLAIGNGGESTNAADLYFSTATGGSTYRRMTIRSNGNVAVDNSGGSTLELTRTSTNTSGLCGKVVFGNTDWDSSMASVQAYQDGGNDNASLRFYTQAVAAGGEQERIRITSGGQVNIGGAYSGTTALLSISGTSKGFPNDSTIPEANFIIKTNDTNNRWIGIGASSTSTWIQATGPGTSGPTASFAINPAGGYVAVGHTNPGTYLHAKGTGEMLRLETTASGGGQCYINFDDETTTRASIGLRGSSSDTLTMAALNGSLRFDVSNQTQTLVIDANGVPRFINSSGDFKVASTTGNDGGRIILQENTIDAWSLDAQRANGYFRIKDSYNNKERLRIHSDGEVEIAVDAGNAGQNALLVSGNYSSNNNVSIQTWQRIGGAVQARMIYRDATTDMSFGTSTAHNFSIITDGTDRIKIANNSAATSIGGSNVFNAMLTVQGDISGEILRLKATENTTRLMVSGNNTNDVEMNFYDKNGAQKGIIVGGETNFAIKAPGQTSMQFMTNDGYGTVERAVIDKYGILKAHGFRRNSGTGNGFTPLRNGYQGDDYEIGPGALYYVGHKNSSSSSNYSAHELTMYKSGHWGQYTEVMVYAYHWYYTTGYRIWHIDNSGNIREKADCGGAGIGTITSGGQQLVGSGTHGGQNVYKYQITFTNGGVYRQTKWYVGWIGNGTGGHIGNSKTVAEADTFFSTNGGGLHFPNVAHEGLLPSPKYQY